MGKARKFGRQKSTLLDRRRSMAETEVMLMGFERAGVIERKGDLVRAITFEGGEAEVARRIDAMLDDVCAEADTGR